MDAAIKTVTLGENTLNIRKLDPWKRLIFIADLQKEFLVPLLNSSEGGKTLKQSLEQGNAIDYMGLLTTFSSLVDGRSLERWMKRILDDGIVYTGDEDKKMKMTLNDLNRLAASPLEIINLIKEAIQFNMDDLGALMKMVESRPKGIIETAKTSL